MNTVINFDTEKLFKNWKTTANGFLSLFITTGITLQVLNSPLFGPKFNMGLVVAMAVARAWVGLLQKDAGTTLAIVPGELGVQSVPSHETPDNIAAQPVSGSK